MEILEPSVCFIASTIFSSVEYLKIYSCGLWLDFRSIARCLLDAYDHMLIGRFATNIAGLIIYPAHKGIGLILRGPPL